MGRKQKTIANNFWSNVNVGAPDECWPWMRSVRKTNGYGQLIYQDKNRGAHQVAYLLTKGEIPEGMQVCHQCDFPRCCNPKHLWLGTNAENQQDSIKKGRRDRLRPQWRTPDIVIPVPQRKRYRRRQARTA